MDTVKIKTGFTKGIISKIINRTLKKKFNANSIDVRIEDLNIEFGEEGKGNGNFSIIAHGTFTQDDISKLLSSLLRGDADEKN